MSTTPPIRPLIRYPEGDDVDVTPADSTSWNGRDVVVNPPETSSVATALLSIKRDGGDVTTASSFSKRTAGSLSHDVDDDDDDDGSLVDEHSSEKKCSSDHDFLRNVAEYFPCYRDMGKEFSNPFYAAISLCYLDNLLSSIRTAEDIETLSDRLTKEGLDGKAIEQIKNFLFSLKKDQEPSIDNWVSPERHDCLLATASFLRNKLRGKLDSLFAESDEYSAMEEEEYRGQLREYKRVADDEAPDFFSLASDTTLTELADILGKRIIVCRQSPPSEGASSSLSFHTTVYGDSRKKGIRFFVDSSNCYLIYPAIADNGFLEKVDSSNHPLISRLEAKFPCYRDMSAFPKHSFYLSITLLYLEDLFHTSYKQTEADIEDIRAKLTSDGLSESATQVVVDFLIYCFKEEISATADGFLRRDLPSDDEEIPHLTEISISLRGRLYKNLKASRLDEESLKKIKKGQNPDRGSHAAAQLFKELGNITKRQFCIHSMDGGTDHVSIGGREGREGREEGSAGYQKVHLLHEDGVFYILYRMQPPAPEKKKASSPHPLVGSLSAEFPWYRDMSASPKGSFYLSVALLYLEDLFHTETDAKAAYAKLTSDGLSKSSTEAIIDFFTYCSEAKIPPTVDGFLGRNPHLNNMSLFLRRRLCEKLQAGSLSDGEVEKIKKGQNPDMESPVAELLFTELSNIMKRRFFIHSFDTATRTSRVSAPKGKPGGQGAHLFHEDGVFHILYRETELKKSVLRG